jgi:hypothetical protein
VELIPEKPGGVVDLVSPAPPPPAPTSNVLAPRAAAGRDEAPLVIVARTT